MAEETKFARVVPFIGFGLNSVRVYEAIKNGEESYHELIRPEIGPRK